VISVRGNTKLGSIYDPFKGSSERLLDLLAHSKVSARVYMRRLDNFPKMFKLAPTQFVLSHKSSPSNKEAFSGILSDYALLRGIRNVLPAENYLSNTRGHIWENIQQYLNIIGKK